MKKYNLMTVQQKNHIFYALVADPRIIVRLIKQYAAGQEQEIQRPWDMARVKDIAAYVAGAFSRKYHRTMGGRPITRVACGVIPTAPILNIKDERLGIHRGSSGQAWIELPDTEEEFADFVESVDVVDGQHRIRAFMDGVSDVQLSPDTPYEMLFSVFDRLSSDMKEELFIVTNDEQKTVPENLLRKLKREMGLLSEIDDNLYTLFGAMNTEDYSPLKTRIALGGATVKKGYKESQLSKILKLSGSYNKLTDMIKDIDGPQPAISQIISNYLTAWEEVYKTWDPEAHVTFRNPGVNYTFTKIAGLRYILYLFSSVLEIIDKKKVNGTLDLSKDNFKSIIQSLPDVIGVPNVFKAEELKPSFHSESATADLARNHGKDLTNRYTSPARLRAIF